MSLAVEIVIGDDIRRVSREDLPLAIGGTGAELPLVGIDAGDPVAFLGLSDDQLFLQPGGGEPVVCNGVPVGAAQWLYDGDVIRIGANRIIVSISPDSARFTVQQPTSVNATIPPAAAIGGGDPVPRPRGTGVKTIKAAEFRPRTPAGERVRKRALRPRTVLIGSGILLLIVVTWLLLTARSVEIVVDPPPDSIAFRGGLSRFGLSFEGRHLVRPGTYRLEAAKAGYEPLDVPVTVTREGNQRFRFEMRKLPGYLALTAGEAEGATVLVDGAEVGSTPLEAIELEPGEHELRVRSERYEEYATSVTIEGGGVTQELSIALVPRFAPVTILSEPPGATIRAGGERVGVTPLTAELIEGSYTIHYELAGYKPERRRITVVANVPQTVPSVGLRLTDGRLVIHSDPEGATVEVDGTYRGVTPLDLVLAPGPEYSVEISKAGHGEQTRKVSVSSGRTRTLEVSLEAQLGEVTITGAPPGAELLVDGQPRGEANRTLRLVAVPHTIEVRKEGHQSFHTTVTPRPGFAQSVDATLKTAEQVQAEVTPPVIRTSQDQELILIDGGRFRMGAPRREPGRRSNETMYDVELARPFYIAAREVSNKDFREFRAEHLSGKAGGTSLNYDHHPVVRVAWEDAAEYCNWLSRRDSLPPAYVMRGGRLELIRPPTVGYRLPTEAEWAFVARFPDGETPLKYPWGDSLPLPEDAGNFGDDSAERLLSDSIAGYDDHYPATAPVGSFDPNPLGLFNLGGNVAEWVHDYYSVHPSRTGEVERDPLGPETGDTHVIRGASWMDTVVSELRLTYREEGSEPRSDLGFRIARYAE